MKITKKQKEGLDWFVGRAVREGCLDEDRAKAMSYQDKQDYLNWSDAQIDLDRENPEVEARRSNPDWW